MADKVIELGQIAKAVEIIVSGETIGDINLEKMGEGKSLFPYVLILEQSKNERILYENLKAPHNEVLWGHRLLNYARQHNGYLLYTLDKDGQLQTIETDYVVSCEGADSFFRKQLGVGFEGGWLGRNSTVLRASSRMICGRKRVKSPLRS